MPHWTHHSAPAESDPEFEYLDESFEDREFYPLDAPGMPVPGPDFLIMADDLGDFVDHDWFLDGEAKKKLKAEQRAAGVKAPRRAVNKVAGSGDQRRLVSPGPRLERLYRQATYSNWCLKIHDKVGESRLTHTVPGHVWSSDEHGPRRSRVMVVGKWPGHNEMSSGRNLVGASGDEFREALLLAGVPPEEFNNWYVTNVVKHPDFPDSRKDKIPARWANNWRVVLEQELRIVRPDFILLLGTDAVKHTLVDMELGGVTSVQGRSLPWKICLSRDPNTPKAGLEWHRCKVMACRHPAHVLREPIYREEFRGTVRRFKEMMGGGEFDPATLAVDHRVVDTEEDLAFVVDGCLARGEDVVALDCEWHGAYPGEPGAWLRTVQFSTRPGFAVCVRLRRGGYDPAPDLSKKDSSGRVMNRPEQHPHPDFGKVTFRGGVEGVVRQLTRLLVDSPGRRVRVVGHNLRADLPWLALGLDRVLGEHLINQFQGAASPELTRTEGGFDTTLAVHAVYESPGDSGYKLEAQALNHCGVPRYDDGVARWKKRHCRANKIKKDDLPGYGCCPDEELIGVPLPPEEQSGPGTRVRDSYSCFDADVTFRLYEAFNGRDGRPGRLDADPFGQDCRKPFWISMRSSPACLEMEMNGISVDRKRAYGLIRTYRKALNRMMEELRSLAGWKKFNPQSSQQCCALLFGPRYAPQKYPGQTKDLGLEPVATTGKPKKPWARALQDRERNSELAVPTPNTDKETLGILRSRLYEIKKSSPDDARTALAFDVVDHLRNIRFVAQVLKAVLASHHVDWDPKKGVGSGKALRDEHGDLVYSKGLLKWVHKADGKVHTHVDQKKETGRYSTTRPPLQNLSKRREKNLKDCLGKDYTHPIRTILRPSPGWVFVEADYIGAELYTMAIQSGDPDMIDHCVRSNLPEKDPNYYDIHSNQAVRAFQLKVNDYLNPKTGKRAFEALGLPVGAPCPATKSALQAIGRGNLRDVAKCVAAGTRLLTDRGWVKVEDLCGHLRDGQSGPGSGFVISDVGMTPLVGLYNGGVKPCMSVYTSDGYNLASTFEHQYRVIDADGDYVWKRAADLSNGDWVAVLDREDCLWDGDDTFPPIEVAPRTNFKDLLFPARFDEDWAAFVGLYLAEGSANPETGCVQLSLAVEHDPAFGLESAALMARLFGDRARVSDVEYEVHQDQTRLVVSSVKLARWIDRHCPGDSHSKAVPEFVFRWPPRLQQVFLRWLFEGDGSVKKNGKGYSVTYCTASHDLAWGLQVLLSGHGVYCRLHAENRAGKEGEVGEYQILTVKYGESRRRFSEKIGFVTAAKNLRCVSEVSYSLDWDQIPNQTSHLARVFPHLRGPAREKCRECLRRTGAVRLTRNRLRLMLNNLADRPDLPGGAEASRQHLQHLVDLPVRFDRVVELSPDFNMQVYDVQTTDPHSVCYDGLVTHQTIVFGIPYGRGDEAVLRAVEEEGTLITLAEARAIRESILKTYARLGPMLEGAQARVRRPGYIVNCHGRRRRFYVSGRDDGGKSEREAGNFIVQSGVADQVSIALDNLYSYRCRWHDGSDRLAYRMVLQIHDAVLFEVRPAYVEWFVEEVLPECMTQGVSMWQCDFDGRVVGDRPFHLGVDSGVYKAWGEKYTAEEGEAVGLPARFCT